MHSGVRASVKAGTRVRRPVPYACAKGQWLRPGLLQWRRRGAVGLSIWFEGGPSRILDRLDGRCEKAQAVKNEPKVISLRDWKDGVITRGQGRGYG